MTTIDFYSYEQQDEFAVNIFNQKRNGFFLDIACGHPILGNNTYTLDKTFGWNGLCFELGDARLTNYVDSQQRIHSLEWDATRNGKFVQMDVTTPEFAEYLRTNIPADLVVDYISLDVDAAGKNLALITLQRIVESGIKFKAMTLEHEIYLNNEIQGPSRDIMESMGYKRLFEDVRLWGGGILKDEGAFSEDWWIHPDYIDSTVLEIKKSGAYFFDCIKALKEYRGATYQGHHHCSQAFANEVDYFADSGSHSYGSHAIRTPGWKSAWE